MPQASFRDFSFSPDGTRLALAASDGGVRLIHMGNYQEVRNLAHDSKEVAAVAWSPDGGLLATATLGGLLRTWEPTTGKELTQYNTSQVLANRLAFTADGQRLVALTSTGHILVWSLRYGSASAMLAGPPHRVQDFALSPDGSYLATRVERERSVSVWDLRAGRIVRTYRGPNDYVTDVAFSPDGAFLAASSSDGTVRVWDFTNGSEARTLGNTEARGVRDQALGHGLAFSRDGALLGLADAKRLRVWQLGPEPGPYGEFDCSASTMGAPELAFHRDGRHIGLRAHSSKLLVLDRNLQPLHV